MIAVGTVRRCQRGNMTCMEHASFVTGRTRTLSNPEQENLDVDVLTADLVNLIRTVFPDVETAPSLLVSKCDFDRCVAYAW